MCYVEYLVQCSRTKQTEPQRSNSNKKGVSLSKYIMLKYFIEKSFRTKNTYRLNDLTGMTIIRYYKRNGEKMLKCKK